LQLALARHRAGALPEAEQLYRRILATDPNHFDARYGLGVVLHAQGRPHDAVGHFEEAVRLRPGDADAWLDLGTVLGQLGHVEFSIMALSHAAQLAPASTVIKHALAQARANEQHALAVEHTRHGRLDEAAACCRKIIELLPELATAHENLGHVLLAQGKLDEAEACCRKAIELDERCAPAHQRLGLVAMQREQFGEAECQFRRTIELRPDWADAHNQLGAALIHQERLEEAEAAFRQALTLQCDHADALNNLGAALAKEQRWDEAISCFERVLQAHPDHAEALFNLGKSFNDLGRHEDAVVCIRRALERKPDYLDAELDLAFTLLKLGRLVEGWPHYEARWRLPDLKDATRFEPRWAGQDLGGRAILLGREQGFGDTIQFLRYAELVKQRGGRVIVECLPALAPLVARTRGVDEVFAYGQPPPVFEAFAPLMSLPGILGTTMETIPAIVPYLAADPAHVEHWRASFAGDGALSIGIVWQGNRANKSDHRRSIPLESFAAIARTPGVRLYSLQLGDDRRQLADFRDWPITDLGGEIHNFHDTAAIMSHLDLVITCDSAPAHVAGALGRPVWVALAWTADWRWFLDRDDSPWYPTMRLFRQTQPDDWAGVFERMAEELAKLRAGQAA
jgi:tetratricopeptide (TPR) repeat protein